MTQYSEETQATPERPSMPVIAGLRHSRRSHLAMLASLCASGPGRAFAADAVTRFVLPYPPGGATDPYVRTLAEGFVRAGMPAVLEHKPGGSGVLAAQYVSRAKPDGTTLLIGGNGILVNNVALFDKLPYDPVKDFEQVGLIGYGPMLLLARHGLPYSDVTQMVQYAKTRPRHFTRASNGTGTTTNIGAVYFEKQYGYSTTHVPYQGLGPAVNALLAGDVDIFLGSATSLVVDFVRAGRIRALGVMGGARLSVLPDVPTMKEAGFPCEVSFWLSVAAPAGTPPAQVTKLNETINRILAEPQFAVQAKPMGIEPRGGSVAQMNQFLQSEMQQWVPAIRDMGIKEG